jgi:hypothetical protein
VDSSTCYAVGASGTILKTTNGGANWSNVAAQQNLTQDGAYSYRTVVRDAAGNETISATTSMVLDTTADVGNDLALTIADTSINNSEKNAVKFSVVGIDGDVASANATVTFTGIGKDTGVLATVTVQAAAGKADLSSLIDGTITTALNVTESVLRFRVAAP